MESLLSTSPLMVAAAPDMDLMSCVDYFLDRCVGENGEIAKSFAQMSVRTLLRDGGNQHTVGPGDIPELRVKAKACLQVCMYVTVLGWIQRRCEGGDEFECKCGCEHQCE